MAEVTRGLSLLAGDILTCLGELDATWSALLAGRSGLVHQIVSPCTTSYPLGLVSGIEGSFGCDLRLQGFLRQLLKNVPPLPPATQLFVATTKGAVDDLDSRKKQPDPRSGQPWTLARSINDKFALETEPVTVSGACASGSLAVIQAAMAIDSGQCKHALVVAVDLVADFVVRGFDSLKALSPTSVRPFDKDRDGLALGDGGAWLFMSSESALTEQNGSLAQLDRWGIGCDATHITAPCRKGSGLSRVFDQMLTGRSSKQMPPGGINGHGTGTGYNDAMEMLVFDDKCGASIPFCSVKGAIGHSLGAAGLIEVMLSVKSLKEMKLPPTVGLSSPEGDKTNVSGTTALPLQTPSIISCNSGFGGINAGLLLSSPE